VLADDAVTSFATGPHADAVCPTVRVADRRLAAVPLTLRRTSLGRLDTP
jgi:hypothetical protein